MGRRSPEEAARETLAGKPRRRAGKRAIDPLPPAPLIVRDGIYFAADLERIFGVDDQTVAQWKRDGLPYAKIGRSHVVHGAAVIDFFFPPTMPAAAKPAAEENDPHAAPRR